MRRPSPGCPANSPFVRGADRTRDVVLGWRVTERFGDDDTAASAVNEQILDACANGTSGLWLRVGEGIDADGLDAALAGVYLDLLPVTLDVGADVAAAEAFLRVLEQAPAAPQEAAPTVATTHSLGLSPLTAGFSGRPSVADADAVALAVRVAGGAHADRVRTARGRPRLLRRRCRPRDGAGPGRAGGVAHVRALVGAGLTAAQALRQVTFAISVTDDQFGAIAKLRALRLMWAARVAEVLGVPDAGAAVTHAVTDLAMFAQRDPWVNMLRCTVAAFGAGWAVPTRSLCTPSTPRSPARSGHRNRPSHDGSPATPNCCCWRSPTSATTSSTPAAAPGSSSRSPTTSPTRGRCSPTWRTAVDSLPLADGSSHSVSPTHWPSATRPPSRSGPHRSPA